MNYSYKKKLLRKLNAIGISGEFPEIIEVLPIKPYSFR